MTSGVMISRAQISALYGMKQAAPMFLLTQADLGGLDVKDPQGKTRSITIEGAALPKPEPSPYP